MRAACIIERREDFNICEGTRQLYSCNGGYSHTQVHLAPDAFHSADQPLLQFILDSNSLAEGALFCGLRGFRNDVGDLRAGKEVHQVHNPFFVDVTGLEDIRGRQILLLRGVGFFCRRADAEVATLVLVEQTAEYGGRIKIRPGRGLTCCSLTRSIEAGLEFPEEQTELTST